MAKDDTNKLLLEAAFAGDWKECKVLLELGADVNAADWLGWTAMMHAASAGHNDIIKNLLAYGADVSKKNSYGVTVLSVAVATCADYDTLYLLYTHLPPPLREAETGTVLRVASLKGLKDAVLWLLNDTAVINLPCPITGMTPLMLAVVGQKQHMAELLIKHGADPTLTNHLGENAFDLALASKDTKMIGILNNYNSPEPHSPICFNFTITKPEYHDDCNAIDSTNCINICSNVDEETVFYNSPNRPQYKTCDDDLEPSLLTPNKSERFTFPQDQGRKTPQLQDRLRRISGLVSPRYQPQRHKCNSPSVAKQGQKRKYLNSIGCSFWKILNKRRTKSFEDSDDYNYDSKNPGFEFSQLLFFLGLEEFYPMFKKHELNIWTFLTLTEQNLEEIGIKDERAKEKIFKSIQMVKKWQL